MIEKIFARGLRAGQRWGFKEIRYHRVLTVRFLEKLFPNARFVILRRDIAEESNAEVAEALHLTVPAVKSRLHRARLFLRGHLNRYFAGRQRPGAGAP